MFEVKDILTGEIKVYEDVEDLKELLHERYFTSFQKAYEPETRWKPCKESLDDWFIREKPLHLELVVDTTSLSVTRTNVKFLARELVRSCDWTGSMNNFDESLFSDLDFALEIIESPKWNGSLDSFSENILEDETFWDKVVDCPQWNGIPFYLRGQVRSNIDICLKIIKHPNWNGVCLHFLENVKDDERYFKEIVNSEKWNGSFLSFTERYLSDPSKCLQIINSAKWRGSCSYFKGEASKYLSLYTKIVKSDK